MEQRHPLPASAAVTDLSSLLPREECVWEILKNTDRPIVLYGTGNGGDKLIDALAKIGRTPDGVFASDGFVRSRTFHDMPVRSLADAEKQFGHDMIILCAFGSSLPDVMDHMRWLNRNYHGGVSYESGCRKRNAYPAAPLAAPSPVATREYRNPLQ